MRRLGGRSDGAINEKLVASDGLYTDGLSSAAGNPQIDNSAQHAQTYPIYYGVAPAAKPAALAGQHHRPGHEPGPDDMAHAAQGAGRPRPLRPGRQAADRRERRRPGADARPAGHVHVGAVEPRLRDRWPCVPSNNESMSHGWGAWGIVDMIESLLGVEVTSPGAATVGIEPPAIGGRPAPRQRLGLDPARHRRA